MEWRAQSPENPVENLWGDLKNVVSEAKPQNWQELWNVARSSWAESAGIKNSGYATKY